MESSNAIVSGCGFHHVAIRVADFEATVRFYTGALGFRQAVAWTSTPEMNIAPLSSDMALVLKAPNGFTYSSFRSPADLVKSRAPIKTTLSRKTASPDRDGSARIAQAIYAEIRGSHDWGKDFPEGLAEEVQERAAELSPREMRRAIMNAFGTAKLAGRDEIDVSDIDDARSPKKQRIGF